MKVDVDYYLGITTPDNIDAPKYMLGKYAYGGQCVHCEHCGTEHGLAGMNIKETFMDTYDRRLVVFNCPKCGKETMDMLDIGYLHEADLKKNKYHIDH